MSMVGEDKMSMDLEIKEVLDGHTEILEKHSEEIKQLQIQYARTDERLISMEVSQKKLEKGIDRLENLTLNNHNTIINTLNQLIMSKNDNDTKKEVSKKTNNTNIIIQVIIGVTAIGAGLIALLK